MQSPDLLLLYVKNVDKSAGFYRDLLNREPQAAFSTYVAFSLDGGFTLALWSAERAADEWASERHKADLALPEGGNRFELAFQVKDDKAVEAMLSDWQQRGVEIAQEPKTAVFGRTFVGLDPDGHRIRVCVGAR